MILRLEDEGPLHRQLAQALRMAIKDRELTSGERAPSSRQLARQLGISRNTVLAAYAQLLTEGYLEAQPRSGTFVSRRLPDALLALPETKRVQVEAQAPLVTRLSQHGQAMARAGMNARRLVYRRPGMRCDFRYGVARPDRETRKELLHLHAKAMDQDLFDYTDPAGDIVLREQLALHLRGSRGIHVEAGQIVITAGSQQGLDLCARLLLDPGDAVVVENPSYQGAHQAFSASGGRLIAASVDHHGLDPSRLSKAARRARLLCVTPSHQFPTGATMPVSRRLELLAWAAQNDAYIVEDDYDSEFRYDSRPVEAIVALAGGAPVIYLGTFAKSLFPSLRIGLMIAPQGLCTILADAKWLTDRGNASIDQRALAMFIASGGYARHLRRMNRIYSARRALLVELLVHHFGSAIEIAGSNAGTHLVVWFSHRNTPQVRALAAACAKQGVGVYPIAPYYLGKPRRAGLLLGFAGISRQQIRDGVPSMARVYGRETGAAR